MNLKYVVSRISRMAVITQASSSLGLKLGNARMQPVVSNWDQKMVTSILTKVKPTTKW